jgi:hypothetical protein
MDVYKLILLSTLTVLANSKEQLDSEGQDLLLWRYQEEATVRRKETCHVDETSRDQPCAR